MLPSATLAASSASPAARGSSPGSVGDAAAPERERVAGQCAFQLAQHGLRGARGERLLAAGDEQQDLDAGRAVALGERRERAAHHRARPALDDRARAGAPALLGRRLRVGASDDHARPVPQVERQLGGARQQLLARGLLAPERQAQEVCGGALRGDVRGAHALHLRGDHRDEQPPHERARLGSGAHVQRSDDRVGDPQRHARHAVAAREQRALVGAGARGDGDRGARGVGHREARVERARGGAHDLGQARPGLDRLGDGIEPDELRHRTWRWRSTQPQK